MARLRGIIAAILSCSLLYTPPSNASSSSPVAPLGGPLGAIVYADRAHLGAAKASTGATVFPGDQLSTEPSGSVQVRVGAARLLLSSASSATLAQENAAPTATLTAGSATFSTANSKAFVLHVATAAIRPTTDQPTIGQVTVLNPKELVVKSKRGSLTIAVEDDVREIPEGAAYRIVLDPSAAPEPQGPRGAGTKDYGKLPRPAAKNKFIWYAIAVVGIVTIWAVHEALESPDRP